MLEGEARSVTPRSAFLASTSMQQLLPLPLPLSIHRALGSDAVDSKEVRPAALGGESLNGELGAFSEGFSTRLDPAPQLNWAGMRPYELKKHCRGRGLAEEGSSKATLVARLEGREQPEHSPPVGGVAIVAASDPVAEAKAVELKEAAKSGSVDVIQALLADDGVDVDVVDGQGYTPLYCATMYEQEDAVAVLLAAGAEVDKENNNGVSPLMAAARDGYTAIVTRLLSAGADFLQVDECPVVLYKIDR